MLRLVAQHADIWNGWAATSAADIPAMRSAVDDACARIGRDPATLRRTVTAAIAFDGPMVGRDDVIDGDDGRIAAALAGIAEEGIDAVQLFVFPTEQASMSRLGRIIDQVTDQVATGQTRGARAIALGRLR